MLPKKNRIARKDFPSHKTKGIRGFSPFFSIVFYKGVIGASKGKVSVVVSKKTAKTAVSRNKLRRRFYDLLGAFLEGIKTPTTIVVYPKKEAEKADFTLLKTEMEKVLKQAIQNILNY
ncbi:MAG: ribonuclease P protein component [bacterium]|nr:ribonuclease P protein component [bacterium]